jgi:hypothetical protein
MRRNTARTGVAANIRFIEFVILHFLSVFDSVARLALIRSPLTAAPDIIMASPTSIMNTAKKTVSKFTLAIVHANKRTKDKMNPPIIDLIIFVFLLVFS